MESRETLEHDLENNQMRDLCSLLSQNGSLIARLFAWFSSIWMVVDIVLDCFTIYEYKTECDNSNHTENSKTIDVGTFNWTTSLSTDEITCYLCPAGQLLQVFLVSI